MNDLIERLENPAWIPQQDIIVNGKKTADTMMEAAARIRELEAGTAHGGWVKWTDHDAAILELRVRLEKALAKDP